MIAGLSIEYLKKASETPAAGAEEIRKIVADMLADIEAGRMDGHALNGDDRLREYFRDEESDLQV